MEALRRDVNLGRKNIDNLVLMQAAVPAHCKDTNFANYSPFMGKELTSPTPDKYRGYSGESRWYRLGTAFEADFAPGTCYILRPN